MPHETRVDSTHRVGLARVYGAVSGEALAAANEALYDDAAWRPGFDELWQCDQITEFVVLPQELKAVVEMEKRGSERVGTGRVALVITRDVVKMIGELYQHLVSAADREVQIFETLNEAAAWLRLPAVPVWFMRPHLTAEALSSAVGAGRHGW